MSGPGLPDVTVVVPVRDGVAVLGGCLEALAAQTGAGVVEVVVVDNGSRDGSAELARGHRAVSRVIVEPVPGSYAARNAGARAARGSVLAFTDADCRPHPTWIAAGRDALGRAHLAGGEVRCPPTPAPSLWERYDRATYLDQGRAVRDEGYAATANLFVRRDVLEAVGPFDDTLRSSGDLEWGQRATSMGYRLVHAPAAVVDHLPRRTAVATWRLHRRLGAGWRDLAATGRRPRAWREPALRVPFRWVAARVAEDGRPVPRLRLAAVHGVVLVARWTGRLLGDSRSLG